MVTINKAAELTGIKYSALRRWIKSGDFTYFVMVGSKYLINLERLAEFLNKPHQGA
jgi:excisionase family DNA binding protein